MSPDPTQGVWREEAGYDVPQKVGLIDVDRDGTLEAGYALANHNDFICRDLWTGETKWSVPLPAGGYGPVLVADADGDGKGEFLVSWYCLGTDEAGKGVVRWQSPVYLGWAVIADFDGDGAGEIACPAPGRVQVLKGQ
jgi:outer membrane protein assembly factor BamB